MSLARLLEQADRGPWWFDGRDIFHTKPGTNLDQIIIPIPSAAETFLPEQGVTFATGKLAALAPDMAQLLIDMAAFLEDERENTGAIRFDALLARFAKLDGQAKETT